MINREITIKYKGYDPNFLKPQSGKKICAICDNCKKCRWISLDHNKWCWNLFT